MSDDPFSMFSDNTIGHDNPPAVDTGNADDRVTLTKEQFDALMSQQKTEADRNMRMFEMLLQGRQGETNAPAADTLPQFQVDLNGLPDPRDDVEGYHKGMAERLGKAYSDMERVAYERVSAKLEKKQTDEQLGNTAWAKLRENHPEFNEFPEVAEMAATRYFSELRAKGVDPLMALRSNMDDVISSVAATGQSLMSKFRGENSDEPAETGRTKMLTGNGPSRGRTQQKASKEADTPNDFVNDLKQLQRNMRLY